MQIEIPQDLFDRILEQVASTPGASEIDVIRRALDSLQWQENERIAIQQGVDAMNRGQTQRFDEFDREFRNDNDISPNA